MADAIEPEPTVTQNTYELAYTVSDRVQIRNVILADCEASRTGQVNSSPAKLKPVAIVSGVSYAEDTEAKQLNVMISFVLKTARSDENESEMPVSIKATFVLFYAVDSFDGIEDEHLKAFSGMNGVFNAWPYWRELVQNVTGRMGLTIPIVVPVLRLGQTPSVDETPEPTPQS
jgi:hypothetical protein